MRRNITFQTVMQDVMFKLFNQAILSVKEGWKWKSKTNVWARWWSLLEHKDAKSVYLVTYVE